MATPVDKNKPPITTALPATPVAATSEAGPVQAPIEPKRKREARESAEFLAKNHPTFSWKQFGYQLNRNDVKGTALDRGMNASDSLGCYIENYKGLKAHKGPLLDCGRKEEMCDGLVASLEKSKSILGKFPNLTYENISNESLKEHHDKIWKELETQLQKEGRVYFQAGYTVGPKKGGHVIVCQIIQTKTHTTVTFLNVGEGVVHHNELDLRATHYIFSMAYPPCTLSNADWEKRRESFLNRLIRFKSEIPEETDYEARELYDALALLGPPDAKLLEQEAPLLLSKWQRMNNCADQGARLQSLHFLRMQRRYKEEDIERFFFNADLVALNAALHAYIAKPNSYGERLVKLGVKRMKTLLVVMEENKWVSEKESREIEAFLKTVTSKVEEVDVDETPQTPQSLVLTKFPKAPPPLAVKYVMDEVPPLVEWNIKLIASQFQPQTLKADLEGWHNAVQSNERIASEDSIELSLMNMPIPKWNDPNDPWNNVPLDHIPAIIANLEKLLSFFPTRQETASLSRERALTIFTLYGIIDKLCRRMPSTRLAGFTSPYEIRFQEEEEFIFPTPFHEERYFALRDYFTLEQQASNRVIFPIEQQLTISQYLEQLNLNQNTRGANHVAYLKQFNPALNAAEGVATAWHSTAPKEVQVLYRLAIYSRLAFHTRIYSNEISYYKLGKESFLLRMQEIYHIYIDHPGRSDALLVTQSTMSRNRPLNSLIVGKAYEGIPHELALLLRHPNLKFSLALDWMQSNIPLLGKKHVQDVLWNAFFGPGVLQERLKEKKESTIKEFRSAVASGLKSHDLKVILYLTKLSTYFESKVNDPLSRGIIRENHERIKALSSTHHFGRSKEEDKETKSILAHALFVSQFIPFETTQDFIDFYSVFCRLKAFRQDEQWKVFGILSHYQPHAHVVFLKLQSFLQGLGNGSPVALNTICNSVMKNLTGEESQRVWALSKTSIKSANCIFSLHDGAITHAELDADLISPNSAHREKYGITEKGFSFKTLWWGASRFMLSYDQRDGFYSDKREGEYIWFTRREEQAEFIRAHFTEEAEAGLYFLPHFKRAKKQITAQNAEATTVAIYSDFATRNSKYTLQYSPDGVTLTDREANGALLADLKGLDPQSPLYAYTLQIAAPESQLCFVRPGTNEIESLKFLNIPLSFKRNGGGLESDQYPGFFFVPTQIESLGSLSKKAIVLRNAHGKYKVLLLDPDYNDLPLGTEKKESKFHISYKGFTAFDLTSPKDRLKGKTLSERLAISYFFKMHGEYEKAYENLQTCFQPLPIDDNTLCLLRAFSELPDKSGPSLAFNLKLACLIADRFSQMSESQAAFCKKILEESAQWLHYYLRAVKGVDKRMRLSEGEEERLLTTYKREGIKLTDVLHVRTQLYQSNTHSASLSLAPQSLAVVPSIFHDVPPANKLADVQYIRPPEKKPPLLKDPARVDSEYIEAHFITLFESAKKGELTTDLPTLLRVEKESSGYKLASILFYVNYYAAEFRDIQFKGDAQDESVFAKVVQRVSILRAPHFPQPVPFNYKMQRDLKLSASPKVDPLPPNASVKIEKTPLKSVAALLFKEKVTPAPHLPESFLEQLPADGIHETEIRDKLKTGNNALKTQMRTSYELQREGIDRARVELNGQRAKITSRIDQLRKEIDTALNDPYKGISPQKARQLNLRIESGQTYLITPEDVMREVILKQDGTLLAHERPMLQKAQIWTLLKDVNDYYHNLVLLQQCDEALALTGKIDNPESVQELAEILNYSFDYDPAEYPEISYLKVKTGKLPRGEQLAIFKWVCEGLKIGENRLFQFPAAGGKTTFLIPLFILHIQRYPYLATIFSTSAIFNIESGNLSSVLQLLGIKLATLKIGMHTKMTAHIARMHLQDLNESLRKKEVLHMTPEVYLAIRLHFFMACNKDEELAGLLLRILDLFKTKAVQFVDESHRNMDPMTQSIFGSGEMHRLSLKESTLLLELMKPVLGMSDGAGIKPYLKESHQSSPTQAELAELQRKLSEYIAPSLLKQLDPSMRKGFMRFWCDKDISEVPPLPAHFTVEERSLVLLTRYFILDLLPELLKMRTDLEHVYSEEHGLDTPSHHKVPSKALFENPYFSWIVAIKGLWHRGLLKEQLTEGLNHLKMGNQRLTAPRFEGWVKEKHPGMHVMEATTEKLHSTLKHHPGACEHYLTNKLRDKIGFASEQYCQTPTHFVNGFKLSVGFSATPLPSPAHPRVIKEKEKKYNEAFQAEVMAVARKHTGVVYPGSPTALFAHMQQQPKAYENVRALIDTGFLHREPNETVAHNWLSSSELDGVLYFDETREDQFSLLLRVEGKIRTIHFNTGNLESMKQELKQTYHLEWEKFKIGAFFDVAHAEAANIDLGYGAQALLMASERTTLPHLIQAIMRMRGFLKPHMNQSLLWCIPSQLRDKMKLKDKPFHPDALFQFCAKNDALSRPASILMSAAHHISFTIEETAFDSPTREGRIKSVKKYNDGFNEKVVSQKWLAATKMGKCDEVLYGYAEGLYQRFYGKNTKLPGEIRQELKPFVTEVTKTQSDKISHAVNQNQAAEMHQKVHVKQQVKTTQHAHKKEKEITAAPVVATTSVTDPNYVAKLQGANLARNRFKIPELSESFYIESNQFHTAFVDGVAAGSKRRKQIDFLLITHKDGKYYAEALSQDSLSETIELMKKPVSNLKHQSFVIRAKKGQVEQLGTGSLAPTKATLKAIEESEWLQNVRADVAFLNGELSTHPLFVERQRRGWSIDKYFAETREAFPQKRAETLDDLSEYRSLVLGSSSLLELNFRR